MNKKKKLIFIDLNAKAMWQRKKNVIFKDKTKYSRKIKHKKKLNEE